MPKLSAVVDDVAALPEPLRDLYTKAEDGKYVLDVAADEHPAVRGLKSAHERQKDETRLAKAEAQQYRGLGLSADEIAALVKEKRERDEKKLKDEGQWESLRQQQHAEHTKVVGVKDVEIAALHGELETLLGENVARQALTDARGNPDIMLPHVLKYVRVVKDEATGRRVAVVVDAQGNKRIAGAAGAPMTIAQLVDEFKQNEKFAGGFYGSGASGSGAAGSSAAAGAAAGRSRKTMSDAEKSAYIDAHGIDAYTTLPA